MGLATIPFLFDVLVGAAPKILDTLGAAFPVQSGGFVVGPMAELGWGSQAGFVKAKIGIVLALPDPKLVLLGTVDVGVPSLEVEKKARIIDLHAEVLGELTPDYLVFIVSIVVVQRVALYLHRQW